MLLCSIGDGGANQAEETALVQLLLNDWLGKTRQPLLAVDGRVGPLTIGAVKRFQTAAALRVVDGRVDPAGPTVKALVLSHVESVWRAFSGNPYGRSLLRDQPFTPNVSESAMSDVIAAMRSGLRGSLPPLL